MCNSELNLYEGEQFCSPFLSPEFNDRYFSDENGLEESKFVFVETNNITMRISTSKKLTVGELGFGTGLNLLAILSEVSKKHIGKCEILFYSVEKYVLSTEKIDEMIGRYAGNFPELYNPYLNYYKSIFDNIKSGFNHASFVFGEMTVDFNLYFGDVFDFLRELNIQADCWLLDGHSPDKNSDMWSTEVCSLLYEKSKEGATIATFTAAGVVKRNLRSAGFFVKRMKGYGAKRHKLFGQKL